MQNGAFNIERILGMCERFMYFLGVNLCFLAANLPVLLFFSLAGISQVRACLPLFLLCMVPFGPSLSAVFYCMNRLLNNTETSVFKNFLHGYKSDLSLKLTVSFLQMFCILVLWTNVEFFRYQMVIPVLSVLFTVLFAVVICMTPTLYLLASRYRMSVRQLIQDAVILLITRPVITLGNIAAFALVLMFLEIQAGTTVLFMGTGYGFLVVFMNRKVIQELDEMSGETA
ncbi:DUF624 domain-containing protein [Blautia schinkii]|nr:DUF624 domain-containing protein [Blautia schinkii]